MPEEGLKIGGRGSINNLNIRLFEESVRGYYCPFTHNSDGPVPAYCLVVLIFHVRRPHAGCNNQKPRRGVSVASVLEFCEGELPRNKFLLKNQ